MKQTVFMILTSAMLFSAQAPASDASLQEGQRVFDKWCAPCHAPGIKEYPGTIALHAKYGGKLPAALEQRTDLTAELISYTVRHGVSVMPIFRKTEVSDEELDALVDYLTTDPDER